MSTWDEGWYDDWPDAASWTEPTPEKPKRRTTPILTVRAYPGQDPEVVFREAWGLHVHASLLEDRCPRCGGELWDEFPDRPGWRRCRWNSYPDGWWRRERVAAGSGGGWEWKLGMNPFTGDPEW